MTAPGPSAAEAVAVHMFTLACGAPLAVSRRRFLGEGIDKEDRDLFLSHAREALTAALPLLRAEIEAEVREETTLALVSGLADKAFTHQRRLVVVWDDVLALLPDLRAHVAALPPQGEG